MTLFGSLIGRFRTKIIVLYVAVFIQMLFLLSYISAVWQHLMPSPSAIFPPLSEPVPLPELPVSKCGYLIRRPPDGRLGS